MGSVLVLGAYGLAGRAIVRRLLAATDAKVVASGRRSDRLVEEFSGDSSGRLRTLALDATDSTALTDACREADVVVNAVGPYDLHGAAIARTVVGGRRHYIDCANEQVHFEHLRKLDAEAADAGVLLVTGAGVAPGLSTLVAAHLLESGLPPTSVEIVYAQLRHAYPDGGQASVMGGVLDAVHRPWAIHAGERVEAKLGRSVREMELPAPFGRRRLLEVPTIDVPVLAARVALHDARTWFYLGDQPPWLFGLIRLLDPTRRRWAYRLIERIVTRMTRAEYDHAVASGLGTDVYLGVTVGAAGVSRSAEVHLTDGASPTAVLPARIASDLLAGTVTESGLRTPIDLYRWRDLDDDFSACVTRVIVTDG